MGVKRRQHDSGFKAKVALEAVKQEKTIAQLSGRFGIHANMITKWKKHLLTELPVIFSKKYKKADKKTETLRLHISHLSRRSGCSSALPYPSDRR